MTEPKHTDPSTLPRLRIRRLRKRFSATLALDEVSLDVAAGEVHALVGENGAGKSTLMNVLAGVVTADSGELFLDGQSYQPQNPHEARQQGVGMIHQELSLAPHLSVEENLTLGTEPCRGGFLNRRAIREQTQRVLKKLGHPEIRPDAKVGTLSLSAQQLVEVGRALILGCRVLILDEPTSSLTQADTEYLFALIRELKAQGLTVIYISHFLEEVDAIADRVTVLRDGRVINTSRTADTHPSQIIHHMVGREIRELYPRSPRQRGEALLQVQKVSGADKPREASLMLHRGEVFGIFGLLGAGRSEFMRLLFGLKNLRGGQIRLGAVLNDKRHPPSPTRRWRQGMGLLSESRQEEGLAPHLNLAENLCLSHLEDYGRLGFTSPRRQKRAAKHWIERLGIRCEGPGQKISALSGGNQQKVALARLLEKDVDVMLLDEPTRGIDVAAKATIYEIIDQAAMGTEGRLPKAILIVSSYLPELLGICDRIAVMGQGVLSEVRDVAELSEHELMVAAVGMSER